MEGCLKHVLQGGTWTPVTRHDHEPTEDDREELLVCTMNVLFSHWKGKEYHHAWVLPSTRYVAIFDELLKLDPDVIAFNECTIYFCRLLGEHALGAGYWLGGLELLGEAGGNVVLVKRTLKCDFSFVSLPRVPRRAVVCRVADTFTIVSAHLSALSSNHERRAQQLRVLTSSVESSHDDAPICICGDLNFHSEAENRNIPEGWIDTEYVGFTWDSSKNPMHAILWPLGFENRSMRLDRVLVRGGTVRDCHIICDKPVFENGAWEEPGLLDRSLWQMGLSQPDPKRYLMPSDHFGLSFRFFSKKVS